MSDGMCAWCGELFVTKPRGKPKRYCSDNCRKRACDDRHRAACQTCGGPLASRSGWPNEYARERCASCVSRRAGQRHAAVIQGYRAGKFPSQIARELGTTAQAVSDIARQLRAEGVDIARAPAGRPRSDGACPPGWTRDSAQAEHALTE